ncbi:integrase core domain-containing protein [Tatumella sp. UCD-D_suzukii]|uniref:integrase core domain-containing protein n=1 Tax=Tatumella sp. UCD-D_suzukii TaxID=1408192 RepID=UPI003527CA47
MANSEDWNAYISQVSNADRYTLRELPTRVKNIGDQLDDEHAAQLANAIGLALLKDPVNVLKAADVIDAYPDELQQRFGTSLICAIPSQAEGTPAQIERYFSQAEPVLIKAGATATACLEDMRAIMDEFRQEYNQFRLHSSLNNLTPAEFARSHQKGLGL